MCDRQDGNTGRSTKTRLLGQADRNHANLMHVGLLLLQPRGDREIVLSGSIRGWQANPSEFTYLFLFFSFLFVGLMITDQSCFQMGKRTGTGVEKSLDKCFVKAWVMRKIWTNPIGIPVFLEISSYVQLLVLLDGRSRTGLWGNLSELR